MLSSEFKYVLSVEPKEMSSHHIQLRCPTILTNKNTTALSVPYSLDKTEQFRTSNLVQFFVLGMSTAA